MTRHTSYSVGCVPTAIVLTMFAAWATHIVWLVSLMTGDGPITGGQLALGVFAAVFPPAGVVHGAMLWIGAATW